jgi:hypothetical protein
MQLELGFWPRDCVRSVLTEYLAMRAESIVQETRIDYETRAAWLWTELGEATPAGSVTYLRVEEMARRARVVLADPTIRMRLQFWAGAVDYARMRGILPPAARMKMPPWLKAGGQRFQDFHTPAQHAAFRMALPPDKVRRYADLGQWTGQHTRDVETMARWMLDPDYVWEESERRGRWWRRNHKNRRCVPCWVPMEPELREIAVEWLAERGAPEDLVVGPVFNKRRHFDLASARSETPRIRPNLGKRSSHASELLARGYTHEYVRIVLGHQGEIQAKARVEGGSPEAVTTRPTILSSHYARQSPNILRPTG